MDEMTCINTKHLAEKVKKAFEVCRNSRDTCYICPYKDSFPCTAAITEDVNAVINGYQEQLEYVVSVNEKNAAKAVGAELSYGFLKGFSDELEKENRELKENNARLVEQNKKLLEQEIENTRLRNENQAIRDDNKYLDERNEKLIAELCNRDRKIRDLCEEIDRYKKQENMLAKQPTMLYTEPVKIEPVNYSKLAKAADKAAKSLDEAVKALNKLNSACDMCPGVQMNRIRAMFGLNPLNTPPHFIAMPGDVFRVDTPNYGARYFEVARSTIYGVFNKSGSKFVDIVELYRKDENGNLKLIWKK